MTETQFRAEMRYQVAIAMAKTLLKKGLLTPDEYTAMDVILLDSVDTSLCKHICPQRYAPDLNSSDKG